MYRINLVLMAVLSLAVVGAAVFLSVNSADPEEEIRALHQRLLYRLSDSDPDISREAREEILAMGPSAIPMLREAAASKDDVLANRADHLLAVLTGGKPAGIVERDAVAENGDEDPDEADRSVRFVVQPVRTQLLSGESPQFYVRLINGGPVPIQVAYQRVDDFVSCSRFAWFEIVDPEGRVTRVAPEVWSENADLSGIPVEYFVIESLEARDLYFGGSEGLTTLGTALEEAGVYRIRFVYDASEESEYARAVESSGVPANPLASARFASNEVEITVSSAR